MNTVLTSLILKSSLQSWVSEKFILSRKLYDIDSCQQMGIITLSIINAIWRASTVMELLCNCTLIKWSSNYSVISWWFVLYKIFALHKQTMLSYNSERMWISACWYWNICQIFMIACSRNSDCFWAYFLWAWRLRGTSIFNESVYSYIYKNFHGQRCNYFLFRLENIKDMKHNDAYLGPKFRAPAMEKFLPKPDLYIGWSTWANLCFTVHGCKSHPAS